MKFLLVLLSFLSIATFSSEKNWETTEKYGIPILQNKNNKDIFVQIFINGPDLSFISEEALPGGLVRLNYNAGSAGTSTIITEVRGIIYHPKEEMFLGNFPISFSSGGELIGEQPEWKIIENMIFITDESTGEEWSVEIP